MSEIDDKEGGGTEALLRRFNAALLTAAWWQRRDSCQHGACEAMWPEEKSRSCLRGASLVKLSYNERLQGSRFAREPPPCYNSQEGFVACGCAALHPSLVHLNRKTHPRYASATLRSPPSAPSNCPSSACRRQDV